MRFTRIDRAHRNLLEKHYEHIVYEHPEANNGQDDDEEEQIVKSQRKNHAKKNQQKRSRDQRARGDPSDIVRCPFSVYAGS